jgi:hypothetical protein
MRSEGPRYCEYLSSADPLLCACSRTPVEMWRYTKHTADRLGVEAGTTGSRHGPSMDTGAHFRNSDIPATALLNAFKLSVPLRTCLCGIRLCDFCSDLLIHRDPVVSARRLPDVLPPIIASDLGESVNTLPFLSLTPCLI